MAFSLFRLLAVIGLGAGLAACLRHQDMPVLLPVGSPVNPAPVAHVLCTVEAQAMYEEAKRQYRRRARMGGYAQPRDPQEESTALDAADRKYAACVSSEGYRLQ